MRDPITGTRPPTPPLSARPWRLSRAAVNKGVREPEQRAAGVPTPPDSPQLASGTRRHSRPIARGRPGETDPMLVELCQRPQSHSPRQRCAAAAASSRRRLLAAGLARVSFAKGSGRCGPSPPGGPATTGIPGAVPPRTRRHTRQSHITAMQPSSSRCSGRCDASRLS